jgi:hypothetical protein
VSGMDERDDNPVLAALEARLGSCWERLDDVVSELMEVHDVPVEEIVGRVVDAASDDDASENVV